VNLLQGGIFMATRILGRNGPTRRRRFLAGSTTFLLVALASLYIVGAAQAVHDLQFQLDGDTSTACGTVPDCSTQTVDWNSLFNANGSNTSLINPTNNPGFTNADFVRDFGVKVSATNTCSLTNTTSTTFCTGDSTTYATGSKDTLNITPGWQCNHDNNVNSKIDIMNGYSAAYTAANGDKIIYFGLDKNKDNGNNNVGFWFLQGSADCSAATGTAAWSGNHQDGDVLVTSAFTSGGGVSSILAYRWAGGANGCIDSNDNPNPKTGGCNTLPIGSGGDCKSASSTGTHPVDAICATTNSGTLPFNGNITTKWLTADATLGVGHTVVPPNFFEGGIDITKAFASAGGTVPSCFNTFIGDTRSSQSPTATLFDYTRGELGECTSTLATKAGDTANGGTASPTSIGTGQVSSGSDTATLTVTGTSTWGGTLTWYLCGPDAALTTCDNTGVQVTSRTVSNSSSAADFVSGTANLTSAGKYCWTAHFEPNAASKAAGVSAADDDGTGECFTVNPVTPTLTTTASCTNTPCVLGTDTLSDTASLTGTASEPGTNGPNSKYPSINATSPNPAGGSIVWSVFLPAGDGCTTSKTPSGAPVAVSGDNTAYGPVTYKPALADGVGVYTFAASYAGDGVNTNAAPGVTCPDAANGTEHITVTGSASSASAQRWLPNDRVVLTTTGGTTLTGTLTVTLFADATCGASPGSSADAVTGQQYTFTPSGAASGSVFQTTNTTFFVGTKPGGTAGGAAGSYSWLVHYQDSNLTSPSDRCETSTVSPITDGP
jgi:hypothetical protein